MRRRSLFASVLGLGIPKTKPTALAEAKAYLMSMNGYANIERELTYVQLAHAGLLDPVTLRELLVAPK